MHPLEKRIAYKFRNPLLLAEALTHSSLSHETHRRHFDNQRLEFLGDAVLQILVSHHLYQLLPRAPEGEMTKLRARLVSRDALAVHARKIQIGAHLLLGRGEEANDGRKRASTIADAFEALLGAMFLDGGMEPTRTFFVKLATKEISECLSKPTDTNPKGILQEILQSLSQEAPIYEILSQIGPEHSRKFRACVMWHGEEMGRGSGGSKKIAEISAAKAALKHERWKDLVARGLSSTRDPA